MEKHSNVPTSAVWNEQDNRWELGEKNEQGKMTGIWNYWHADGDLFRTADYNNGDSPYWAKRFNKDGTLQWERLYNQHTGGVLEHHEYLSDKLQTSVVYGAGESMQSYYHRHTDPLVVSQIIVRRNGDKDCTNTYFDETGDMLYSFRTEEVSNLHQKAYFNGLLVREIMLNADPTQTPVSIRFFYQRGNVMLDYTPNGDGTGWWRLYDEAGQEISKLLEPAAKAGEDPHRSKHLWAMSSYTHDKGLSYWNAVTANFKKIQRETSANEKVHALPVPEALRLELEKIDWINTDTGMGSAEDLPLFINGLLSEEEEVAQFSLNEIWDILDSGYLAEAAYYVAVIVVRMLPFYPNAPTIQQQLILFFNEFFDRHEIGGDENLYQEMLAAVRPHAPLIVQLANDQGITLPGNLQRVLNNIKL